MSNKTLLTITALDTPVSDIEDVISLALSVEAHLNIVVIGLLVPPPSTIYGAIPDSFNSEANEQIILDVKTQVNKLEKLVQKAGLSASVTGETLDRFMVAYTVAQYSLCADLIIFKNSGMIDGDDSAQYFNGALFETGRPILSFSKNPLTFPTFSKVLIAWNGAPQAAKAVHHALPYLAKNAEVHVAIIDPSPSNGPHPGDDLAAFLARNDLRVTVDLLPSSDREIASVLLQKGIDIDAELIVMGGYGHSRFYEWMFGGTTSSMLATSKIPLLMAN